MNFKKSSILPENFYSTILRLSGWQKALIIFSAWVMLIGPFVYFYAFPSYEEIKSLYVNIPKIRQEVETLLEKEKQLPIIKAEIKEMENILENAVRLLPESKDIPSLLTEISTLGNTERLEFLSFKPGKEITKTFYTEIPINMEITAPFHSTMLFFDKISRMARIVNLTEVAMDELPQELQSWSKKASQPEAEQSKEKPPDKATGPEKAKTEATSDETAVESTWVIKTRTQAMTYRFLTIEEQKAAQAAQAAQEAAKKAGAKK